MGHGPDAIESDLGALADNDSQVGSGQVSQLDLPFMTTRDPFALVAPHAPSGSESHPLTAGGGEHQIAVCGAM